MMACKMCGTTDTKMIQCNAIGDVCVRCCFKIASGNPELLKKIKDEKHLSKNDVLKLCSDCKQEIKG